MWLCLLGAALADEPALVQIDWQAHPAMHIPWGMFGAGLTDRELGRRTWRHQFRQTVTEPTLRASGVRIVLAAAMAAERARNPEQARRLIVEQLDFVEDFVARHPEHYALARTPAEARRLVTETDKLVLVHSIEGGHHLLWEEGDAAFWAERGVALVTLIHLRDDELGGSAILDRALGPWINRAGARAERRGEDRGLTELGARAMVALDEAGILVDLSHMSHRTTADALDVAEAHGIPPVITHGRLASIRDDSRGVSTEQLVRLYRLGGVFSLGLNGGELGPGADPDVPVPDDVCWGTLEAFAWHHQQVQDVLAANAEAILGRPWEALEDPERTRLATGWSSDWNGWTHHSRPTAGCREHADALEIDRSGLAHPGLLPEHWHRVQERGVDLDPMLRSAERFLQLWESVR